MKNVEIKVPDMKSVGGCFRKWVKLADEILDETATEIANRIEEQLKAKKEGK